MLTTSNIIQKQAVKSEEYTINLAHTYLSQKIDELIHVMNFVQFDADVIRTLNQGMQKEISPRSYLDINSSLDQLTRNSDISVSIVPVNQNQSFSNRGFTSKFNQENLKMKGHTFLDNLSSFNVYWFSNQDFNSDEQRIILGRRIVNYSGTTIAYLYAGIDGVGIDNVLNRNEFQATREFLLLDSNRDVLYGTLDSAIENNNLIEKKNNSEANTFFTTVNDINYLVVQKRFLNSDWSLVSYMPYSEIVHELRGTYRFHIYLQLFLFTFLIIMLLYAVNRYTRPINRLASVANEIQSGDLQVRSNIDRQDEIGKLSLAFDTMLDTIQENIKQITIEQQLKNKAEIAHLHAKIKPHFMYNVLNTIRLQVMKNGDNESSNSISMFSQFLRSIYTVDESITLEKELEHTVNYLNLVNTMRKYPISIRTRVENDALFESVPSFFLQPIVENAVKHADLQEDGMININVEVTNDYMTISIKDNGVGVDDEQLKDIRSNLSLEKSAVIHQYEKEQYGIGLENIYQRMKILYGSKFMMKVENGAYNGFVVKFKFPLEEGCRNENNAG
ncbi:sensor histidine kinase [Aquibacillus albus]|uniref:histidine kinase n=1 Tax=Aquibacillus albus TaxID=1168171 RepID=A0ABS2MZE5_9BACI|nr:sensor histidine kinase [Aquibacillus albus]MBM7571264.1 two-component system sensor histidine kinase YesM [Aquibacillus albus]